MSCARFADQVLEHALGEAATAGLEGHLRDCAACRAALERERRLLSTIDGELRHAVTVDPSPSFLPRVRQSASKAPARPAWLWPVLVPIAAGLAVAALTLMPRERPAPGASAPAPEAPPPAVADRAPASAEPRRPAAETRVAAAAPRKPAIAARPRMTGRQLAEILVPPGEEELLQRFVAGIRTGRVDATSLAAAVAQATTAVEFAIAPLAEISSLEVKPLTPGVDSEGVDE